MNTQTKLFDLLPALYRLKDAQLAQTKSMLNPAEVSELNTLKALPPPLNAVQAAQLAQLTAKAARGPLESLLTLVEEQLGVVANDLDQLYDDQFIETCAPWVIPYIGDLIGYESVKGVAPAVASPRAEVAHTISFRRRKGTVLVLEQLARDVTGWGAHAVEFFKVLADTQYLNHLRPFNHYAPNLRHWEVREFMNTAFDRTAHTLDLRRIAPGRGRYHIQNIGVFLWSLNAYSLTMAQAAPVAGSNQWFRFSPLGADLPLFNNPVSQGADITAPAQPVNVPDFLRRHVLCRDLWPRATPKPAPLYYGLGKSLALFLDGSLVTPDQICVCDLSGPDGSWANTPPANSPYSAAIDPQLGRIALAPPVAAKNPRVQATCYYGFAADLGGGEYPREDSFAASANQPVARVPGDYPTIHEALNTLPGDGVVEITDSGNYPEPNGLQISIRDHGHVELRAHDGCRPTIILGGELSVTSGPAGALDLNGLLITYAPPSAGAAVPPALIHSPGGAANQLTRLGLTHLTVVPGWALGPLGAPQPAYQGLPTILIEGSGVELVIQKSIVGGIFLGGYSTAQISDSVVDATARNAVACMAPPNPATPAPEPAGALTLIGCTVIGKVHASLLQLVSNSIIWAELAPADHNTDPPLWNGPLWAARKQEGCVRFSFLPQGSVTPRQFKCVDAAPGSPEPLFASVAYGTPGYVKLFAATPDAVRRGADDGGEMGAFHFLLAPLRETDLRVRLQEYIPVGLEYGIFYET